MLTISLYKNGCHIFKSILSQSMDLFNNQIKYKLKIYTLDLSLNLPYIIIYLITMFDSLTFFYFIELQQHDIY